MKENIKVYKIDPLGNITSRDISFNDINKIENSEENIMIYFEVNKYIAKELGHYYKGGANKGEDFCDLLINQMNVIGKFLYGESYEPSLWLKNNPMNHNIKGKVIHIYSTIESMKREILSVINKKTVDIVVKDNLFSLIDTIRILKEIYSLKIEIGDLSDLPSLIEFTEKVKKL